ncbi:hypothetical protein K458DRAFT_259155, partial [Lentithecium fluviatile CBS 122367]
GDDVQSFWAHKELICSKSDFFAKALNGKWKEADENVVKLPEVEAEIFELYMQLLYTEDPSNGFINNDVTAEYIRLFKLCVLCEKLQDRTAKNRVIDAVVELSKKVKVDGNIWLPGASAVSILYEGTTSSSRMRTLLADFLVERGHDHWLSD